MVSTTSGRGTRDISGLSDKYSRVDSDLVFNPVGTFFAVTLSLGV